MGARRGFYFWGFLIFVFNVYDLIPNITYSESVLYSTSSLETNSPEIAIKFEYSSKGAFIAGEDNPIEVLVIIAPFTTKDLFEKIKKGAPTDFVIAFEGARVYAKVNEVFNIPIAPWIYNFTFDENKNILYDKTRLYYPTSGDYSPAVYEKTDYNETYSKLKHATLKVSSSEVGLQLINNARILALTLVLLGVSILALVIKRE